MPGVDRPVFTKEYVENQVLFIMRRNPQLSEDKVRDIVREISNEELKSPMADVIVHNNFNSQLQKMDLLQYMMKNRTHVMTPSGTFYLTSDIKKARDVELIEDRIKNRSYHKKLMLAHLARGQTALADLENFRQDSQKRGTNSIVGISANEHSILYDLENFNGVTSLARHYVMALYTFVEKMNCNNLYLPTVDHAINYVITMVRNCPSRESIMYVIEKYSLWQPHHEEVMEGLMTSLRRYQKFNTEPRALSQLLQGLAAHELAYVHYYMNLHNLFLYNEDIMKEWIGSVFDTTELKPSRFVANDNGELQQLKKYYDSALFQLISVAESERMLPLCDKFMSISKPDEKIKFGELIDEIHKLAPETAREVIMAGDHIASEINRFDEIFDVFFKATCVLPLIDEQKNLIRKTVILSDTDSALFTVQDLIKWYFDPTKTEWWIVKKIVDIHKLRFRLDVPQIEETKIANFIVYLISRSLTTYLLYLAYHRGAIGEYTSIINAKNEYMYPVLLRCGYITKHYFGPMTIREGIVLPKPKYDIKGGQFKSSNRSKISNKFIRDEIIEATCLELMNNKQIDIGVYVQKLVEYEEYIYETVRAGELTYIGNVSIKPKAEYKLPERSIYPKYEMWEHIFAEEYGHIHIPGKVPILSFKDKIFVQETYLNWLESKSKKVYQKLMEYDAATRAKLTRMPISGALLSVPEELIPAIDIRSIIYNNSKAAQLVLRSFKVDLNNQGKRQIILGDYYSDKIKGI